MIQSVTNQRHQTLPLCAAYTMHHSIKMRKKWKIIRKRKETPIQDKIQKKREKNEIKRNNEQKKLPPKQ